MVPVTALASRPVAGFTITTTSLHPEHTLHCSLL